MLEIVVISLALVVGELVLFEEIEVLVLVGGELVGELKLFEVVGFDCVPATTSS